MNVEFYHKQETPHLGSQGTSACRIRWHNLKPTAYYGMEYRHQTLFLSNYDQYIDDNFLYMPGSKSPR